MKHLKHLFTALLLLCTTVASAHDFEVGGIYYNITDATNKTVSVTYKDDYYYWYNEYTGCVTIPESVTYTGTTYSVTSIGNLAFYGCSSLTRITIPDSVTSIGEDAFYGCSGLRSVTIPNSVTSIGSYAFRCCTGLTSVVIPSSVTSIGNYAFYECSGLTSVVIPSSVTSIGNYAFYECSGLTSIEIPNSVTSIGDYAFYGCNNIERLYVGNSVESIGINAFAGCEKIKDIKIELEKPIWGNISFFEKSVYDNAILYVPAGTKSFYEKREPWNLFFYIIEKDFTGIDEVWMRLKVNLGICSSTL